MKQSTKLSCKNGLDKNVNFKVRMIDKDRIVGIILFKPILKSFDEFFPKSLA